MLCSLGRFFFGRQAHNFCLCTLYSTFYVLTNIKKRTIHLDSRL